MVLNQNLKNLDPPIIFSGTNPALYSATDMVMRDYILLKAKYSVFETTTLGQKFSKALIFQDTQSWWHYVYPFFEKGNEYLFCILYMVLINKSPSEYCQ